jgi:hypothetical protein
LSIYAKALAQNIWLWPKGNTVIRIMSSVVRTKKQITKYFIRKRNNINGGLNNQVQHPAKVLRWERDTTN